MFNPNGRRFERGYVVYSDRAIGVGTENGPRDMLSANRSAQAAQNTCLSHIRDWDRVFHTSDR